MHEHLQSLCYCYPQADNFVSLSVVQFLQLSLHIQVPAAVTTAPEGTVSSNATVPTVGGIHLEIAPPFRNVLRCSDSLFPLFWEYTT